MNFASDNAYGAAPQILDALAGANGGAAAAYGADTLSGDVQRRLGEIFDTEVVVFLVATGTAANAISLAAVTPPYGAVLCHRDAHVMVDECGAPEFYSGGAKLVGLDGAAGKIAPETLAEALERLIAGNQHQVQPAALSLTQATEAGTVYTPDEIAALAEMARGRGMRVHMDGARLANALAASNAGPAEMTWRAGVDVLSFGATKNGTLAAEAIVLFDIALADEVMYRRKRGGHLISKGRFIAAQMLAYLEDDLWLELARHANAMARRLADGIAAGGARLAYQAEANEVFAVLTRAQHERLRAAGAVYYEWPGTPLHASGAVGPDEVMVRLVTSFETSELMVDAFLRALTGE